MSDALSALEAIRDPALPGLARAVSRPHLAGLFSGLAERRGAKLEELRIEEVSYSPGIKCLILYRLDLRDRAGKSRRLRLAGRLQADGPAGLPEPAPEPDDILPAAFRDGEAGIDFFRHPFDTALPNLARCLDPREVRQALREVFEPQGLVVRKVSVRELGYTPLARAAIRYDVLAETQDGRVPVRRRLVGKTDAGRRSATLYARGRALWLAARGRLHVTPPVGFATDLDFWVQEFLDGERLSDLAGTAGFTKWIRKTAHSAAAFHSLEVPTCGERDALRETKTLNRWRDVLRVILPEEDARLRRLCDGLAEHLDRDLEVSAPVHADLHPANVLISDGHVVLIDNDNMAFGDPLTDVGRFMASLRVSSFRVHGRLDGFRTETEAFLETYRASAGARTDRVALFEAAALMTAAATGFRYQRDNWRRSALEITAAAELLLHGYTAIRRAGPAPATSRAPDPRPWIADREYMRAALHLPMRALGVDASTLRLMAAGSGRAADTYDIVAAGQSKGATERALRLVTWGRRRPSTRAMRRVGEVADLFGSSEFRPQRPVAVLEPLDAVVYEGPAGAPLLDCAGRDEFLTHVARLAGKLNELQGMAITAVKRLTAAEELARLERRAGQPEIYGLLSDYLDRARECVRSVSLETMPSLTPLTCDRVLLADDVLVVEGPRDAFHRHPCGAAVEFVASLAAGLPPRFGPANDLTGECRALFISALRLRKPEFAFMESLLHARAAIDLIRRGDSEGGRILAEKASTILADQSF